MKLATTTGDFDRYFTTYLERIQHVYEAGFRYIDLSMYNVRPGEELIDNDNWLDTVQMIKEYADKHGVTFVQAHGPNVNPLAGDEAYEIALRRATRAIEVCGKLGIPNMVIHPGWDRSITKEEWFEKNREFFRMLFPVMEENRVNVLHENTTSVNMSWYFPKTGAEMKEFAEYVNHPLFHACWDTGHANCEGNQYQEIVDIGKELYALHVNDNRGMQDEHLIPFMGTMNIDEVMHSLIDMDYKGYFTLECSSSLRSQNYWLGHRRSFEKDQRLVNPPLCLQKEMERFMYQTGKYILDTYGVFED